MNDINEARSGMEPENIQEVLDAEDSAKWATLQGQNQYLTPLDLADKLWERLPNTTPRTILDPQVGGGALVNNHYHGSNHYGIDIDTRLESGSCDIKLITANCVKVFEVMDDLYPGLTFDCINANPPFAKRWKVGETVVDSTEYTWQQAIKRGCFGFFISNKNTIEKLGIDQHPFVYHYEIRENVWPNCNVVIGIVWWHNKEAVATGWYDMHIAWSQITDIIKEERNQHSIWNIWLGEDGKLKTYLSQRLQIKRKLTREDILQLHRIRDCHPLTLTTERETRKLLKQLVDCGIYCIQPKAQEAIQDALAQVNKLACPIMPATDFELVAYADEEDSLLCVHANGIGFTPGKRYDLTTATYQFRERFTRNKVHFDEEKGETYTAPHECSLTGVDRFIQLISDDARPHRFMDRPDHEHPEWQHDEAMLWQIFQRPAVPTLSEICPDSIAKNRAILASCEALAGFEYFPGQLEYLCRVSAKDAAIIAADTGCGKTLMAISLITLKGADRALIIAPQGTMRSSEDEEDETEYQASQWIGELRRFAPYFQVFELFNMEDYQRIRDANGGALPPGVYVTYYQAMFQNRARESCPPNWNDGKFNQYLKVRFDSPPLPEHESGEKDGWCSTIGTEKNGIRCICEPSMATLIGDQFDMILLDEAHVACHLSANLTQLLIRLQPRYRYALTATPIPNIVSNIFSLMGWLCVPQWFMGERRNAAWPYARHEINRFEDTFLSYERDHTQEEINKSRDPLWKGKCIKTSPIISAPARLLKLLKPSMAFIGKPSCNTGYIPPKIIDVRVKMGQDQSRLYAHFLDRANIPCAHALVRARKQIAYLRAICADPQGFERGGPKVPSNFNPKTVAVLELVRDCLARKEQVLIICSRLGQIQTLWRLLIESRIPVSRIDSTVRAAQHSRQAGLFKSGKTLVCLMGIKCAASYSFDDCLNTIIGSLEYTYGSYHQGKGRIDRVTNQRTKNIYCILCENTIEETMFDIVSTKQDAATICLHGQRIPREYKPVDLSEILADSLTKFHLNGQPKEIECELQWPKLRQSITQTLDPVILIH